MPQTPMPDAQTTPDNRRVAEEIYDLIMGPIEPDLLLSNIPGLDEKYAGESEEEHDARMKRYEEAYKQFDGKLKEFMAEVQKRARASRRASLLKKESASRSEDRAELSELESAFE